MTRGRLLATAVALVAAALLVAGTIFVAGWWQGTGGAYAPKRMVVHTAITPARSLFGQVLTATVTVVVDPRLVDPATISVTPNMRPFALRAADDGSSRIGRAQVRWFRYRLQCLSAACVPHGKKGRALGGATAFTLRPVRVAAISHTGKKLATATAWPVFGVQSRLTGADLALGEPKLEPAAAAAAPVTWGIRPAVVGAVAAALAGLLLVAATVLIGSVALADGRPLRVLRIPANLTPVERALRLAEHAARHGEIDESRKALERLAVALRRRGAAGAASDAERLAWSAAAPTESRVAELARTVRSNGAR